MSEVLIRMKMPQCCEECRFFAWKRGVGQHCAIDDRITFHATLDGFDVGYERNGDCPLIEIPKHGRLIDADAFIAEQQHLYCENCEKRKGMKNGKMRFVYDIGDAPCRSCGICDALDSLDDAPTVITAEEGET